MGKAKKILKKIFVLLMGGGLLLVIGIAMFYWAVSLGFFGKLYTKKELKAFRNEAATQVFSSDRVLIGKFFDKDRIVVKYEQIPRHVIDALIATEDIRYFEHKGVDTRSLLRVLFRSILLGDSKGGGGSTITQQLLKNMYGRKDYGPITMPVNKTKEMILARRLESVYNKKEILALYLNTVPFGENIYGIGSAARRFYGCDVSDLKIDQGAVLIGLLRANTYYNPRLYPDHAKRRRNVVLSQMNKYGLLSDDSLKMLKKLPIELNYGNLNRDGIANYFVAQVRREVRDIVEEYNKTAARKWDMERDGLIVHTTLNAALQEDALKAFKQHLSKMQEALRKQYESPYYHKQLIRLAEQELRRKGRLAYRDSLTRAAVFSWDGVHTDTLTSLDSVMQLLTLLQAGLVALDPESGAVLAYVGGIDFQTQAYDQIMARRQLASTFKPVLYAAALESGKSPCDYLDNSRLVLTDYNNWSPENYGKEEGGKYSLAAALAYSKNIPTVRLWMETPYDEVNYLWKKMGFASILEQKPSMALGAADANLMELAQAYSAFANGGFALRSHRVDLILSPAGDTIFQYQPDSLREKIMEPRTASLMNAILQKAINDGTGRAIRSKYHLGLPLAGKTGTSQNYSDAWFVAYNPGIIVATRVGANRPAIHFANGSYGSGARLALPLVALTLQNAESQDALEPILNTPFAQLPAEFSTEMQCEDYQEDNLIEKIFPVKKTSVEKERRKAERKRKRLERKKKKRK